MLGNSGCALAAFFLLAIPAQAYVIYIPYTITVPQAEIGNYQNIHTIGVISAIGGKVRIFKHIGFLHEKTDYRDVQDWKLDELVRSVVHQAMGQRFNLVDIPVDQGTIASQISPGLFLGDQSSLRSVLKRLGRTDVDAYIVIRPRYYGEFPGTEAGLSLEVTGDPYQSWLYANYEITLLDAKSFAQIGEAFARMRLDDGTPPHFPGVSPPQKIVPDDQLVLSDQQTALLRGWMSSLVKLSMVETLRALQLGVELPRAGGRSVVPRPDAMLPLPAGKSLAVVSALGDTLYLEHRGTMFRHTIRTIPIPDLKLDEAIEAQVAAALDHRYKIKPAPAGVDRAQLAARIWGTASRNTIGGLPAAPDIDAYVVVFKRDAGSDLDYPHRGFGLVNITPIDSETTSALADYAIAVVDAHTFQQLYIADGVASPDRQTEYPNQVIDSALWPDDKPLTPAQSDGLRQALTGVMADSVPETLLRLAFTDKMVVRAGRPTHAPRPGISGDDETGGETSQGRDTPSPPPVPQKPPSSQTDAPRNKPAGAATPI